MDEIRLEGEIYISSKRASEITGYTNDYIGQLVRAGEINGRKVGKTWFIEARSLLGRQHGQPLNSRQGKSDSKDSQSFSSPHLLKFFVDPPPRILIPVGIFLVAIIFAGPIFGGSIGAERLAAIKEIGTKSFSGAKRSAEELKNNIIRATGQASDTLLYAAVRAGKNSAQALIVATDTFSDERKDKKTFLGIASKIKAALATAYIGTRDALSVIAKTTVVAAKISVVKTGDALGGALSTASNAITRSITTVGDTIATLAQNTARSVINTVSNTGRTLATFSRNTKDTVIAIFTQSEPQVPSEIAPNEAIPTSPTPSIAESEPEKSQQQKEPTSRITINRPIEKVTVEKTIERVIAGITADDLEERIQILSNKLTADIARVASNASAQGNSNFQAIALTNRIDNLSGVRISSATVSGISGLTDADIPDGITASAYLPLAGGTLTGAFIGTTGTFSGLVTAATLGVGTTSPSDTFALNGPAYFAQVLAPTVTTNRLYNEGGNLTWNGSVIGGSVGSWSLSGGDVYRSSGNVGIGTTSPYAKLSVVGEVVAANFTATSTTATSTFTAGVNVGSGNGYFINGQSAVSGQANGPISFGFSNTVSSSGMSFGQNNTSSGTNSSTFGFNNTATTTNSVAFGYTNTVNGATAAAIGRHNTANNTSSYAFGGYNTTSVGSSVAFGLSNTTSGGIYALAFGYANTASASGASVFGSSITNSTANSTMIGPSDAAKLTILSSGNVGIGTTSPYAKLSVEGSSALGDSALAGYFIATSTTATSTFANHISIASGKSYRINGVSVMKIATSGSGDSFFAGQNAGGANTTGFLNTFVGPLAGYSNTSGGRNTLIGARAGYSNLDGVRNTFVGNDAGYFNQSGGNNTFVGTQAGYNNTGSGSVFIGDSAGLANTTGADNLFLGKQAGYANTTGGLNIFLGSTAGSANNTGTENLAIGNNSFITATSSAANIAIGNFALNKTTWGNNNIAMGRSALYSNTTGAGNVTIGTQAGYFKKSGDYNVLIGDSAGFGVTNKSYNNNTYVGALAGSGNETGSNNSFLGYYAGSSNTTGGNNIFLGFQAGDAVTTGSNNIIIGYDIDATSTTATGSLNIGNLIFGTGLDGTGTTLSSGNVGIGTTSPYAKLSVVGEVVAANFTATSTTATSTFAGGAVFATEGGNVGIGTSTPKALFEIFKTSNTPTTFIRLETNSAANGASAAIDFSNSTSANNVVGGRIENIRIDGSTGAFAMSTRIGTVLTEGFRLVNGNVGIGTTSPYAKLSVVGQVVADNFTATSTTATSTFMGHLSVGSTAASANVNGTYFAGGLTSWLDSTAGVDDVEIGLGRADTANPTAGSMIFGGRSRGTLAAPSIVSNGDTLLTLQAVGRDDTDFAKSSAISFEVDGTPGTNIMPGRIVFSTSPAGSQTPTEWMRLTSAGYLGIGTTSPYAPLSVVGQVVGSYFTATSTTATSTFTAGVNVGTNNGYWISGVNVLALRGTPAIVNTVSGTTGNLAVGTGNTISSTAVQSFGIGMLNTISATLGGFAVGKSNTASGSGNAVAFGASNTSSGTFSVTFGSNNTASGGVGLSPSLAFGVYNTASAYKSSAFGYLNLASGDTSSAFGASTTASALFSSSFGYNNIASAQGAIAIGSNITNNTASSTMIGPSDEAKLTILGATGSVGFTGIGTTSPSAMLHIGSAASGGNVRVSNGWLCVDNNDTCTGATTAGTVYAVGAYTTGADLAENYQAFETGLSAGDIVSITDIQTIATTTVDSFGVKKAILGETVLGVISTKPGLLLANSLLENVPVALQGRVLVKVTNENGAIKVGDRIMLSRTIPGVGMKATESNYTVGIALESYDSPDVGTINVFMNLSWSRLASEETLATITGHESSFWNIDESSGRIKFIGALDINDFDMINVRAIRGSFGKWSIDETGRLVVNEIEANRINTKVLCVEDVCVTKEKFIGVFGGGATGGDSNDSSGGEQNTTPASETNTETVTSEEPTQTSVEEPAPTPVEPEPAPPAPSEEPVAE